jgi:hypothetical protein
VTWIGLHQSVLAKSGSDQQPHQSLADWFSISKQPKSFSVDNGFSAGLDNIVEHAEAL